MAKLCDYADFIMGQAPASCDCNVDGVGTPFVKAGQFGESNPIINEWTTNPLKMASDNDVLICVVGATSGKLNRGVNCAIGRSVAAIRPHEKVIRDYIYYGLHPWIQRLRGGSQGSAIGVITRDMLASVEMPFPEEDQQKEIVQTLCLIEDIIRRRKEELEKLNKLIKARFVELFGDNQESQESVPLEDVSEMVTVGIANAATHAYADSGVLMFRNLNIKENKLDDSDLIYIQPEFAAKYVSKELQKDDILVTRTGYPGVACLVPEKYVGAQTFTTLIVRLKKNNGLLPSYICHYINSPFGKRFVKQNQAGVAQQNFGATAMGKMPIVIPTMELQKSFMDFADRIDKSKAVIQKSLDESQLLFDSMMQQYFG